MEPIVRYIERNVGILRLRSENHYLSSNVTICANSLYREVYLPWEDKIYISGPFRAAELSWHSNGYSYGMERRVTDFIFKGGFYDVRLSNTNGNIVSICPII